MKMGTDMEAIERIKGYCCEVTQEQWEELVRVADEVGMPVDEDSRSTGTEKGRYRLAGECWEKLYTDEAFDCELIPYPDFLAKLRGEEQWQPKAGEMVEVQTCGGVHTGEYMGFFGGEHWVFFDDSPNSYCTVDPLRPTITRAEAEQQLGKRIID